MNGRKLWMLLVIVAAVGGTATVSAQSRGGERSTPAAVIIYAEGEDFEILDARNRPVVVDALDAIGQELYEGDLVLTEDSTFLELQLVPSENVVKIAENTNFRIEKRYPSGGGTFVMVYGRVRAKVQKLTGNEKFVIRSNSAVAGVRGTDFGMSVVIPAPAESASPDAAGEEREEGAASGDAPRAASGDAPGAVEQTGEMVTQVYCFDGEVEVVPQVKVDVEPVVVKANEMVQVAAIPAGSRPKTAELTVQPLDEEIRSYWQRNDFKAEPRKLEQSEKQTEEAAPREVREPEKQVVVAEDLAAPTPTEILVDTLKRERAVFTGLGAALFVVGAALEGVEIYLGVTRGFDTLGPTGWGVMAGGAVFVSGGVFSLWQTGRLTRRIAEVRAAEE